MIEYHPVPGCYVLANPLLRDVFSNLINNAFKHSTGSLKIWLKVAPVDRDRTRYYQVLVEDNGPLVGKTIEQVLPSYDVGSHVWQTSVAEHAPTPRVTTPAPKES